MHSDDDNSPANPLVEIASQLRALNSQVGKLNEDLASTKEEIRRTKNAVSKIPTNDGEFTIMFATVLICLVIALTSNPSKSAHITHLLTRVPGSSDEAKALKKLTGDYIIPYFAPNLISYESYYFFSISKLQLDDKEFSVAFGVLGNVFDYKTPADLKEKLNKLSNSP